MIDTDVKKRIRKYMWFPILGTIQIQENTLIQKKFIENEVMDL
jgi:hypothetical protein